MTKPLPRAALLQQFGRGLALGTGGVAVFGSSAALAVKSGRMIDPNGRPEPEQEQSNADVYAAASAVYLARRVLANGWPRPTQIGAIIPASAAVGLAVSWVCQQSGPLVKAVVSAMKELP